MPRTDSPTPPFKKTHLILSLIFLFIALCSALGLDYIYWKRGSKSYLFCLLGIPPIQKEAADMNRLILESLASLDIKADPNSSKKDEKGRIQIPISMAYTEYTKTAVLLEAELLKAQIHTKINQSIENNTNFFLWELERDEEQRASLLFMCPIEIAASPEEPRIIKPKNKVALIIDDMGTT